MFETLKYSSLFSYFFSEGIKCPRENSGGVEWSATAGGGGNIKPCPNGARGMLYVQLVSLERER